MARRTREQREMVFAMRKTDMIKQLTERCTFCGAPPYQLCVRWRTQPEGPAVATERISPHQRRRNTIRRDRGMPQQLPTYLRPWPSSRTEKAAARLEGAPPKGPALTDEKARARLKDTLDKFKAYGEKVAAEEAAPRDGRYPKSESF